MMPNATSVRIAAWMENAWLDRYLDRQLSDEESAVFEAYVLHKPKLLALIEADTRLRDVLMENTSALRGDASVEHVASELAPDSPDQDFSQSSSKNYPRARAWRALPPWVAVAASLLLGLGVGLIGEHALAPERSEMLIANPTHIIYDTMRGEVSPPRLEHADSASKYVLIEIAIPPGAQQIALQIENAPEQIFTESPDGFISALIDRRTLAGAHQMSVHYQLKGIMQQRTLSLTQFKGNES